MATQTYKTHAIVLKKTKLGEKDLIVTMVDESGALLQGVAKGARKPGGSFSARLELFTAIDALMARGRSLDVVCEARISTPGAQRCDSLEQSVCAAPIAELLSLIAQPGLAQPRLFAMARSAFDHIAGAANEPTRALSLTAASLWKVMGQAGYRPSIARCVRCFEALEYPSADDPPAGDSARGGVPVGGLVAFSAADGGVLCPRCPHPGDVTQVDAETLKWCEALITTRFDDIVRLDIDASTSFAVLHLAQLWISVHVGRKLKSLDFLFTSGLF